MRGQRNGCTGFGWKILCTSLYCPFILESLYELFFVHPAVLILRMNRRKTGAHQHISRTPYDKNSSEQSR